MSIVDKAVATQLKNIETKTGKSFAELRKLIQGSGLGKVGAIRDMLKSEFSLGHGDANALAILAPSAVTPKPAMDGHFKTGHRSSGRTTVVITQPDPIEQDFPRQRSVRRIGRREIRRRTGGNVGNAPAISKRGGKGGKPFFGFPGLPRRVISTGSPHRSVRHRGHRRGLGPPAAGTTLEHVAVVQQPVQHGANGRRVAEQFAPVFHGTIRGQ